MMEHKTNRNPLDQPEAFDWSHSILGFMSQLRLGMDFCHLCAQVPWLLSQPRGDNIPVVVIPGFLMPEGTTALLWGYLKWLGYQAMGWGLGVNRGNMPRLIPKLIKQVQKISDRSQKRLWLIGWSLGGVLAREVARKHPEWVSGVITLGTPLIGGPKYTAFAPFYRQKGFDLDRLEKQALARSRVPIQVPITVVFSKRDGIVDWRACIDHFNPHTKHIEVRSSHLGLVQHPEVFRQIAQTLAVQCTSPAKKP